ncbi:hypothetical protein ACOBQB_14155 [Streptomyces sp. G5(2025)]|uniref:hypothetical protein n=1 Tax=Streptomyces sp. G5(2025) TaxID=3406628 RepID=UPI003C28599D
MRDRLTTDREGTLRRLADLGYGAVEPYDVLADPEELRESLDGLGLTVTGAHVVQLLGPEQGPVLDAVATLGTDLAIVPAGIPGSGPRNAAPGRPGPKPAKGDTRQPERDLRKATLG